jgi:hypothetical protein
MPAAADVSRFTLPGNQKIVTGCYHFCNNKETAMPYFCFVKNSLFLVL